jgi:hypothetical protein
MSLVVALTLPDGVILGRDGTTSYVDASTHVSKVLLRTDTLTGLAGQRVGIATYGRTALGLRSIASLLHDFERQGISSDKSLSVRDIAEKLREFFQVPYRDTILKRGRVDSESGSNTISEESLSLYFVIAGYSPNTVFPEMWQVKIGSNSWPGTIETVREPGDFSSDWFGEYDPIYRYVRGYDPRLINDVVQLIRDAVSDQPGTDIEAHLREILDEYGQPVPYEILPVEMGISYVESLLALSVDYHHFSMARESARRAFRIGLITFRDDEFRIL